MAKNKFKPNRPNGQNNVNPQNAPSKEAQAADADVAVMEQEEPAVETLVVETANLQDISNDVVYMDDETASSYLTFKEQMETARAQMIEAKVSTVMIDLFLAELYDMMEEYSAEPAMSQEDIDTRTKQIEAAAEIMGIDLLTAAMPVAEEYRQLLEGAPQQVEEGFRIPAANEAALDELCEGMLALAKFFGKQRIVEGEGKDLTVAWAFEGIYPKVDGYNPTVLEF